MMEGLVFDIQRMSVHDGPGIRTTVFLKGCPLHCLWCHNPESQDLHPVLAYYENLCIGCGVCLETCPNGCHRAEPGGHRILRENCRHCGACEENCVGALKLLGRPMTVSAVMKELRKDVRFYENSSGGITVSGGEPFMQVAFLTEILKAAKAEGFHTCVETTGFAPIDRLLQAADYVDLFLYDYKETDPVLHEKYTGVRNEKILENLFELDRQGHKTILRCPIIPGLNDREAHFRGIARTAEKLKHVQMVHVEPYNNFGMGKAVSVGLTYPLEKTEVPEPETAEEWIRQIQCLTSVKVVKS